MHHIVPSNHFIKRSGQLHLPPQDLAFVLKHGRVLYRTGIQFHFLGRKDIPENLRRDPHISRLEGVTVLLSHDGALITVYKNPQAVRQIRRKAKRRWPAYLAQRPAHVSRPLQSPTWELDSQDREEAKRR